MLQGRTICLSFSYPIKNYFETKLLKFNLYFENNVENCKFVKKYIFYYYRYFVHIYLIHINNEFIHFFKC